MNPAIRKTLKSTSSSYLSKNICFNLLILNEYRFCVDFKGIMHFDYGGPISPTNVIKDRKFIQKFYRSVKGNAEGEHLEFPFVAEFWGEKNYLRYHIAPVVFNNLEDGELEFCIGMKVKFEPELLFEDS